MLAISPEASKPKAYLLSVMQPFVGTLPEERILQGRVVVVVANLDLHLFGTAACSVLLCKFHLSTAKAACARVRVAELSLNFERCLMFEACMKSLK